MAAKDLGTGREQKITITHSSGLTKEDIEKMVSEAASHADEDRRKKQEVETRNKADSLVHSTEKLLDENKDKIPAEEASRIRTAVDDLKKTLQDGNSDAIQRATDDLLKASHRMAELLYQQASAGRAAGGPGSAQETPGSGQPGRPAEGDVIDAEYVDVEEGKK